MNAEMLTILLGVTAFSLVVVGLTGVLMVAKAKLVNKYARGALAYACSLALPAADSEALLRFRNTGNVLNGHDVRQVTVSGADIVKTLYSGASAKHYIEWFSTQVLTVHGNSSRLVT